MKKSRKRRNRAMSRHMKMTDNYRTDVKSKYILEFSEILDKYLAGADIPDGKLSFVRNLPSIEKKAVVYYSAIAWSKMIAIINEFDKEVAWHGLAKKLEPEEGKSAYLIYDIVVYPQQVTGATVNTDQEEYETWLNNFDDETFNAIRMQGHSHVNMGVSPSSVDMEHKESIIRQLDGDMFYIFMIWNKQMKRDITIYDCGENVFYENKDVEIKMYDSDGGLDAFIKEAKSLVKDRVYTSQWNKKDDKKPESPKQLSEPKKVESLKDEDKPRTPYSSFRKNNACGYGNWCDDNDDPYGPYGYCGGMYGY